MKGQKLDSVKTLNIRLLLDVFSYELKNIEKTTSRK